jgi:UDP-N-acetylglucosamine 2-epimerase (non-hydrolysing)
MHGADCIPLRLATTASQATRLPLTDSGGIQEDAPAFGTPVLILREKAERSEGIEAGVARLIGVEPQAIITAATEVLTDTACL